MELYSLRVARSQAGESIPFDRVYAVKHRDRAHIERLFPAALVMPVDSVLKGMLAQIELREVRTRPFARGAAEERSPEIGELVKLLDSGDWILVVPLLPKWVPDIVDPEGPGHEGPRYLTSKRWFKERHPKRLEVGAAFPHELAYLQIRGRKVRPICVACPRLMEHQMGLCKFGEPDCYDHLSLGMANHFREGLNAPEAPGNVKEETDGLI